MMTHGSLFSGIGGFDLAAEWMGWDNKFHCEWEAFPRKILEYHFPKSTSYGDIKETDFTIWNGKIDILTGGFPCQPYSAAGKRLGKQDERHLFPEMLRAVREIEPRWVVGENVRGLVSWNDGLVFEEVQADLESEGYEVQPFLLPAASVNAPHKRDRVWFIAYANDKGRGNEPRNLSEENGKVSQRNQDVEPSHSSSLYATNPNSEMSQHRNKSGETPGTTISEKRTQSFGSPRSWQKFPTQSPVCGGDDGIPRSLDSITFPKWRKESIKAYGNAIVPQVALQIFKAINQYEQSQR